MTFYKVEDASEFNKFHIESSIDNPLGNGFSFFIGMGITDYPKTFKMWLREFPRPIFLCAAKNMQMVGWVYIQDWGETTKEGDPIYVLRAIETLASLRRKKIGLKLLLLSMKQMVGFMVTKPLTRDAERFFKRYGFMEKEEFRHCPVDLTHHHGYLIIPPFKKKKILEQYQNHI